MFPAQVDLDLGHWLKTIRMYSLGLAVLWTVVIAASLAWNLVQHQGALEENARIMAVTAFQKDVLYRRWNSNHGGVYAPVTADTQPNPYLNGYPGQTIVTSEGISYTLINPAYMTRQVFELQKSIGILGHITSLNPIRPANAPDDWEKRALEAFEGGEKEVSSVETIGGESYLRMMRPLLVEEKCLVCHARQGYQLGQVRGGISEAVLLSPLVAAGRPAVISTVAAHFGVWLVGLAGILFSYLNLQRAGRRQLAAEQRLKEMSTHDALTGLYNRAYFENLFHQLEDLKAKPITILMADVDNLKRTNDEHGHAAGDRLIQAAAEILRQSFRTGDTVARIGGDEFVVILYHTSAEQAQVAMERVQHQLALYNEQHADLPVNISFGLATASIAASLQDTIRLADQRMYAEKARKKTGA